MKQKKGRATLLFLVSFYSFFLLPLGPLWAQGLKAQNKTDLLAPVIYHETPDQTTHSGLSLRFETRVTDNVEVSKVTLFFRTDRKKTYFSMNMEPTGKGNYSVSIPKERFSSPSFEYYIWAGDRAGNTASHGFSFFPLTLSISTIPVDQKTGEDFLAPLIQHETTIPTVNTNSPLHFKIKVTDNVGVNKVVFFYRTDRMKNFFGVKMLPEGKGRYATTIPKDRLTSPVFEYYIQAADPAGNIASHGFSFFPLALRVSGFPSPDKVEEIKKTPMHVDGAPRKRAPLQTIPLALRTSKTQEEHWYEKWWVWTIALAVLGGAALGGGGGGDGGDSPTTATPTGSASFSGALPE